MNSTLTKQKKTKENKTIKQKFKVYKLTLLPFFNLFQKLLTTFHTEIFYDFSISMLENHVRCDKGTMTSGYND